jgi:3-hydroxyisobutyrate dehydrogenase-like beta-hydroxyacid dehydrogenase
MHLSSFHACFELMLKKYSIGQSIVDLSGEEPGKASMLKLMGNILIMTTMEQVAEVNVFSEKCGLGTQNMRKLLDQIFPGPPHTIYNQRMLTGDYYRKLVRKLPSVLFLFKGRDYLQRFHHSQWSRFRKRGV